MPVSNADGGEGRKDCAGEGRVIWQGASFKKIRGALLAMGGIRLLVSKTNNRCDNG
jgi:hypothetical protein